MNVRYVSGESAGEWLAAKLPWDFCSELLEAMRCAGSDEDTLPEVRGLAMGLTYALKAKTPTDDLYSAYSGVACLGDVAAAIEDGTLREDGSYYLSEGDWIRPDGTVCQ
jgi:hypothetical protein